MPGSVKVIRILLFVIAAITALMVTIFLTLPDNARVGLMEEANAESLGRMTWYAIPGILSLWLALRIPKAGAGTRRWIIGVEIFAILRALALLGSGNPRGLFNLILPTVILVLAMLPSARRFFRGESQAYIAEKMIESYPKPDTVQAEATRSHE
jgi:hypothetical protein